MNDYEDVVQQNRILNIVNQHTVCFNRSLPLPIGNILRRGKTDISPILGMGRGTHSTETLHHTFCHRFDAFAASRKQLPMHYDPLSAGDTDSSANLPLSIVAIVSTAMHLRHHA
jgi:hypothetical protein